MYLKNLLKDRIVCVKIRGVIYNLKYNELFKVPDDVSFKEMSQILSRFPTNYVEIVQEIKTDSKSESKLEEKPEFQSKLEEKPEFQSKLEEKPESQSKLEEKPESQSKLEEKPKLEELNFDFKNLQKLGLRELVPLAKKLGIKKTGVKKNLLIQEILKKKKTK